MGQGQTQITLLVDELVKDVLNEADKLELARMDSASLMEMEQMPALSLEPIQASRVAILRSSFRPVGFTPCAMQILLAAVLLHVAKWDCRSLKQIKEPFDLLRQKPINHTLRPDIISPFRRSPASQIDR